MATNPIPNMNPTGVVGSGNGNTMPGQGGTGFSSFGTGGPGSMNFGNTANPVATPSNTNAFQPSSPTMNPGSSPAPVNVTGQNNQTVPSSNQFDQSQRQQDRTLGELQGYYGEGMGSMIYQYLQSQGGYNSNLTQQAVDSQVNAMGQQIQLGANNLTSMLASQGINGSGMTGSLTNYMNQAVQQENAITSQEFYNMWNQSQGRELQMLDSVGQVNATGTANEMNWMDYLNEGLEIAGAVAMV